MSARPMPFGERLRRARESKSLTLEQLSATTGLNKATISRLEREPRDPRARSVVKLADALEVSVSFLLSTEDHDLEFAVAIRRQALHKFLAGGSVVDEQQKKYMEQLCFLDSAPNSVRGWQDLVQNLSYLVAQKSLD